MFSGYNSHLTRSCQPGVTWIFWLVCPEGRFYLVLGLKTLTLVSPSPISVVSVSILLGVDLLESSVYQWKFLMKYFCFVPWKASIILTVVGTEDFQVFLEKVYFTRCLVNDTFLFFVLLYSSQLFSCDLCTQVSCVVLTLKVKVLFDFS